MDRYTQERLVKWGNQWITLEQFNALKSRKPERGIKDLVYYALLFAAGGLYLYAYWGM